jgi:hypothetical protein
LAFPLLFEPAREQHQTKRTTSADFAIYQSIFLLSSRAHFVDVKKQSSLPKKRAWGGVKYGSKIFEVKSDDKGGFYWENSDTGTLPLGSKRAGA